MKLRKTFGFVLMMLVMIVSVSAVGSAPDPNNTDFYYVMESSSILDSTPNNNDGTATGTSSAAGIINSCRDFNGASDFIDTGFDLGTTYTISGWYYFNTFDSIRVVLGVRDSSGSAGTREFYLGHLSSNTARVNYYTSTNSNAGIIDFTITENAWNHITLTRSGNNIEVYVGNTSIATDSTAGKHNPTQNLILGRNGNQAIQYWGGLIDEIAVFNYVLNQSEITYLDNGGVPGAAQQWNFSAPSGLPVITVENTSLINNSAYNETTTFNFNVSQVNSNNNINHTFTLTITPPLVEVDGIGYPVWLGSTSRLCQQLGGGSFYTNTSSVKTTLAANETYAYFPGAGEWLTDISNGTQEVLESVDCTKTATNTLTPSFEVDPFVSVLGLNKFAGFTNATLFSFNNETNNTAVYNITLDTIAPVTNFISNSTEFNDFFINFSNVINATDQIVGVNTCFINITEQENVTSPDNFYINCTDTQLFSSAGLHNLKVTSTDKAGNINISLFNITINPFIYVNFLNSSSGNITNYKATIVHPDGRVIILPNTNNSVLLSPVNNGSLDLGIHNITFEKTGYITQTVSVLVNATNAGRTVNFTISQASINIVIRDKVTGNIVSGPLFNLEFIATVGLVTNTTTGLKTVSNLFFIEELYELRTTSNNYSAESTFFTFTNKESITVTVYVINETADNYGIVEIKVVDKFGKSITGALAQALQWDSATSSYKKVSEGVTAEDGKTILNIILDDKQYIFQASNGDLSKNTTPQFIPALLNGKSIVISLDVGPTEFDSFLDYVNYNITENFNNNISNITFIWTTTDGSDVEGYINYYRIQSTGEKTLISTDTDTGSSVILTTSKLLNSSYYIRAEVGFVVGNAMYPQQTYEYPPVNSISNILADTGLAIFMLPLLYLVVVLIGMANVFIGGVLLIVLSGISLMLFPQYMTKELMVFFYLVGIALMIGGAKRK